MEREEQLKRVVSTYGNTAQVDMAIEEMSELTKALLKYRRAVNYGGERKLRADDVAEEMADVRIMLAQLEIIFDNKAQVNDYIEYKINRQMQRIEEAKR